MRKLENRKGNINFVRFVEDQTNDESFRISVMFDDVNTNMLFDTYKIVVVGGQFNDVILVDNIFFDRAELLLMSITDNITNEIDLRKVIIYCVTHHLTWFSDLKHLYPEVT